MKAATKEFLQFLHPGDGYRDIRAISSDRKTSRQVFFPTGEFKAIDTFTKAKFTEEKKLNIFTGVAVRVHKQGGQVRDCGVLQALFVDLDFKSLDEATARAKLQAFPFPVSALVKTGGGLHAYWRLTEPLDLQQTDPGYVKAVLRKLAMHLGADLSAATPERILRIPDTLNYKYNPPVPVELEVSQFDTITDLDELLKVIGPITALNGEAKHAPREYKRSLKDDERINLAKKWLSRQEPAIQGQGGDEQTFKLCCAVLIGHDLEIPQALDAMQQWNATCKPPWSEEDLRGKQQNAEQYGEPHTRGNRLRKDARLLNHEPLSDVRIRPVHWLWKDRLPMGSLTLLAGREGIGKSLLAYQLVADITQGRLPGRFFGTAKAVIIAATEDSYEHTIVPRLIAAGANLHRVYRVAAATPEGDSPLILPKDVLALEELIDELDVALVLLDPIISRLDKKLDSHKDADVRLGLEPMSGIANNTNVVVLGIIHVNKGSSTDPLSMVMGSRAFVAVARSVLFVMTDPEDQTLRMVGSPKNNLGKTDLPSLLFTVVDHVVGVTDEGPVHTGMLVWKGETQRTLMDEIETTASEDRGTVVEASSWLLDYLTTKGGYATSGDIRKEAKTAGYTVSTLGRARKRIQAVSLTRGVFPRETYWCLRGHTPPEDAQQDAPF